jgi:hypothetical protein
VPTIFDGRKNSYPLEVKFLIQRKLIDPQRLKAAKEIVAKRLAGRKSIFSMPDPAEVSVGPHPDSIRMSEADKQEATVAAPVGR